MIRIAALAALLLACAPASARDHGLSHMYRPADGWVGNALVRDIRSPGAPACPDDDDLDAFSWAFDELDEARVYSMASVGCTILPNASWGEILGAIPSGGGYLRLRVTYVHHFRDLDGIEVYVPVMSLRNLDDPREGLWDLYHSLLAR